MALEGEILPAPRPAHWWKPGQSGNPHGINAGEEMKELRGLARRYSTEALLTAVRIMRDGSEKGSLRALEIILAYAIGKPKETIEITDRARTLEQILQAIADARSEKQAQSSQNQSEKSE
jgi:hypothetical protein